MYSSRAATRTEIFKSRSIIKNELLFKKNINELIMEPLNIEGTRKNLNAKRRYTSDVQNTCKLKLYIPKDIVNKINKELDKDFEVDVREPDKCP
jgi:hypothetical protein